MSLINQVLRDLDRRNASRDALPAATRPVPAATPAWRLRNVWVAAGAAASLLGIGATTLAERPTPIRLASSTAPSPQLVTAPSATLATSALPAVATPLSEAAMAPAAAAEQSNAVGPGISFSRRGESDAASTPLAAPPAARIDFASPSIEAKAERPGKGTEPPIAPASAVAASIDPQAETRPAAAGSATASAATVVASPHTPRSVPAGGEAKIEKRLTAATPHERAVTEYQRAIVAQQQGRAAEADTSYAGALREDAGFAAARLARAGLLIGQSRYEEAQSILREGLALDPRQAMFALTLARLHVERGDLQRAAEVLHDALPGAAGNAEYDAFYAAILQRSGRHPEAIERFAMALGNGSDNGVWWMGMAISLAADGRHKQARDAFSRAAASGTLTQELASFVEQRLRQRP